MLRIEPVLPMLNRLPLLPMLSTLPVPPMLSTLPVLNRLATLKKLPILAMQPKLSMLLTLNALLIFEGASDCVACSDSAISSRLRSDVRSLVSEIPRIATLHSL